VRDYWPLCPVSTRLFANGEETFECRDCHSLRDSLVCAGVGVTSPRFPLELARWSATWQSSRLLARCDMVIGVSRYVRDELALSGRIPGDKLVDIPNLVDLSSVARALQGPWPLSDISPEEPFLLFVGKWDTNKGAHLLPEVVARSGVRMPVVLAGNGPLESKLREDAAALSLDFRFVPWLDNDAVLRLMGASRVLVFPSAWQEPLSRVLLEGCAAGAAIAAMNTGGTVDIIVNGESGWLATDAKRLAEGVRAVATDDALNASLRLGARKKAETTFAAPVVSAQVEDLYLMLLEQAEKA
jgi:glycogen synthase